MEISKSAVVALALERIVENMGLSPHCTIRTNKETVEISFGREITSGQKIAITSFLNDLIDAVSAACDFVCWREVGGEISKEQLQVAGEKTDAGPCPVCGKGRLHKKVLEETFVFKGRTIVIPEYVTQECDVCGETIVDNETLIRSDEILKEFKAQVLGELGIR